MWNRQQFIALRTIVVSQLIRLVRIWPQTFLPPVITMSLYLVIFGKMIGQRVGLMEGVPYTHFIIPGLIMITVIQNAYSSTSSSFYIARFARSIEELLTSPAKPAVIILGYASAGIFSGLISGGLVILVSLFFARLLVHHWVVMLVTILLTALLFSLAGLINALFAEEFGDIMIVPTFVLTPLTYLGGVFYSIHLLQGVWYKLTLIDPIFYMVEAFRYGMLGTQAIQVYLALGIVAGCCLLLWGVVIYLFWRGVGLRT